MGGNGITAGPEKTTAGKRPSRPPVRARSEPEKAARACRALCRARVAEQLHRRRGTRIGEHLKMVLGTIDRQQER